MQRTRYALTSLTKVVACAILALGALAQIQAAEKADKKVDPTGTWKWTQAGRQGGAEREFSLKLKLDGEKLTGKLTQPARGGGGGTTDIEIKDGKLKGDEISFTTSVEGRGGNTVTSKYNGKISGDTIKGKIERPGRDGATQETKWEPKREAD